MSDQSEIVKKLVRQSLGEITICLCLKAISDDDTPRLKELLQRINVETIELSLSNEICIWFLETASRLERVEAIKLIVERWERANPVDDTYPIITQLFWQPTASDEMLRNLTIIFSKYPFFYHARMIARMIPSEDSLRGFYRLVAIYPPQGYRVYYELLRDFYLTQNVNGFYPNNQIREAIIGELRKYTPYAEVPKWISLTSKIMNASEIDTSTFIPAELIYEAVILIKPIVGRADYEVPQTPSQYETSLTLAPQSAPRSPDTKSIASLGSPGSPDTKSIASLSSIDNLRSLDNLAPDSYGSPLTTYEPKQGKSIHDLSTHNVIVPILHVSKAMPILRKQNPEMSPSQLRLNYIAATPTQKREMLLPYYSLGKVQSISNDPETFQKYGPSNMYFKRTSDELADPDNYLDDRMFVSNDIVDPEEYNVDYGSTTSIVERDWFNGSCDTCFRKIAKRKYALRKPRPFGGWEGCFCGAFQCVRDSVTDFNPIVLRMINQYEQQFNKYGIVDDDDDEQYITSLIQSRLTVNTG